MTAEPTPWLSHLDPAVADGPFEDIAVIAIERGMCDLVNTLMSTGHFTHDEAKAYAANTLMVKMVATQRQYSPEGQIAMVSALFFEDPLMGNMRTSLMKNMARMSGRRINSALTYGIGLGFLLCALIEVLLLFLR
jgi:hypothetical protein